MSKKIVEPGAPITGKDEVYTVEKLAAYLGCSDRIILEALRAGTLKGHKFAKKWYVLHSELVNFIKQA